MNFRIIMLLLALMLNIGGIVRNWDYVWAVAFHGFVVGMCFAALIVTIRNGGQE